MTVKKVFTICESATQNYDGLVHWNYEFRLHVKDREEPLTFLITTKENPLKISADNGVFTFEQL